MIIDELRELENKSVEKGIPIIGREKGKWLYEKIKKIKPKKILELGTANGYSGCILGSLNGELTTIEQDKKAIEEAEKNFEKFNINTKIINGDAVKEVERLVKDEEKFDLIFIDFSKKDYIKVLENCIKLINKNGVIIVDNITNDKCKEFKKETLNNKRLKTEIVMIRDGLSFSVKI